MDEKEDLLTPNIYNELYSLFLQVKESLFKYYNDFNEERNMDVINNAKMEFEYLKPKVIRNSKNCIVFGDTSAGKSSLINAILQCEVVPSLYGRTTNCFIEIKRNSKRKNYILVDNEEKDMSLLKDLTSFKSRNHLPNGTHVELFYNSGTCPFLNENMVIIDTPGIDTDVNIDENIISYCRDADLIILIVNSTASITNTMKSFIKRFETVFTKLNCFLVFNHWDLPDNEDDREDTFYQLKDDAEKLLSNDLKYSSKLAEERVFFLSAKEQMLILKNDVRLENTPRWETRNIAFQTFRNKLKNEMEENMYKRKHRYLETLFNVVQECILVRSQNRENLTVFKIHIKQLKNVNILNDIESILDTIFMQSYEHLIIKSLKALDSVDNDDLKKEIILNVLNDVIDETAKSILSKIKEYIQTIFEQESATFIKIFEKIYFPLYVNPFFSQFQPNVEYIITMKRRISIAKACSRVIQIFTRIIKTMVNPMEYLFSEARDQEAPQELDDHAFRYICKGPEAMMKNEWKQMQIKLSDCYAIFLRELEEFAEIQKKLVKIKLKIKN